MRHFCVVKLILCFPLVCALGLWADEAQNNLAIDKVINRGLKRTRVSVNDPPPPPKKVCSIKRGKPTVLLLPGHDGIPLQL
jgi:hypothetical protein